MRNRLQLVHKLDVLSHGTRIRVGLAATQVLAHVRLSGDVRLHMLGSVAGVVESLLAAIMVALVWLLPCVGTDVQLEVFQPRKFALTLGKIALVRSLPRVASKVGD